MTGENIAKNYGREKRFHFLSSYYLKIHIYHFRTEFAELKGLEGENSCHLWATIDMLKRLQDYLVTFKYFLIRFYC